MATMITPEHGANDKVVRLIRQFGFSEFCFFLLAEDNLHNHKLPAMNNFTLKAMKRQKHILASSLQATQVLNKRLRTHARQGNNINFNQLDFGPNIWTGSEIATLSINSPEPQLNVISYQQDMLVWTLKLHSGFVGVYALIADKRQPNLSATLAENGKDIEVSLMLFGEFFALSHIDKLNPVENFGVLSNKSMVILNLLAAGMSVDEISAFRAISNRGVCYHIDKLKRCFGCRNRYQLIDTAHKLGMLA